MSAGPSSTHPTPSRLQDRWTRLVPGPANRVPLTPVGFLRRSAEIFPDRLAVVHGGQRIRYAELHQRACRLASALQRRGVQAGDRVLIHLDNCPETLLAWYACTWLGAVAVTAGTRAKARATCSAARSRSAFSACATVPIFSPVAGSKTLPVSSNAAKASASSRQKSSTHTLSGSLSGLSGRARSRSTA